MVLDLDVGRGIMMMAYHCACVIRLGDVYMYRVDLLEPSFDNNQAYFLSNDWLPFNMHLIGLLSSIPYVTDPSQGKPRPSLTALASWLVPGRFSNLIIGIHSLT